MLRLLLTLAALLAPVWASDEVVRGHLQEGRPVVLLLDGNRAVELSGDEDTLKVINDARLRAYEFEAVGHYTAPGRFEVNPIHTSALFVREKGERRVITYFCEVCGIRQATPGICRCCQQEMRLEPLARALEASPGSL